MTDTTVKKRKLGLVIGRFQPFHSGHNNMINLALDQCEQVLVLVGSANKAPDFNNPFNSSDRRDTIQKTIIDKNLLLMPLNDFPSDDDWVQEVTALVLSYEEDPSKVTLYTSDKDEEYYKATMIYEVQVVPSKGSGASGTLIRNELYDGSDVNTTIVPEATLELLANFKATEDFTRLVQERNECLARKAQAGIDHAYSNPIEPVVHAMVIHRSEVLLVRRKSVRGYGQLALPGGFLENTETTRGGALRELWEETGIDLTQTRAMEVACAIEENMDDLSVRTLGINYAYLVDEKVDLKLTINETEVSEAVWIPFREVVTGSTPLFYNHLTIIRRLASMIQTKESTDG